MAYSLELERNIDGVTARWKGRDKKKMFGGVCYLVNGNMCFGIYKDFLVVRLGADSAAESLKEKGVRPFDITGRPMKGWVMVPAKAWADGGRLLEWLSGGRDFAGSLPPK